MAFRISRFPTPTSNLPNIVLERRKFAECGGDGNLRTSASVTDYNNGRFYVTQTVNVRQNKSKTLCISPKRQKCNLERDSVDQQDDQSENADGNKRLKSSGRCKTILDFFHNHR